MVGCVSSLFLPSIHATFRSFVTERAVAPLSNGSLNQYTEPLTVSPVGLEYVLTRQDCPAPALPVASVQDARGNNATSPFTTVTPVEVNPACDAGPKAAARPRLMAR